MVQTRKKRTGITLRDVVNHISDFKQDITMKIDRVHRDLSERMDRMESISLRTAKGLTTLIFECKTLRTSTFRNG